MLAAIAYLLWVVYSILEGKREAYYFSYKMRTSLAQKKPAKVINEHVMFTYQRMLVVALACVSCYTDWVNAILVVACLGASFPFFHDGMYYVTRKELDNLYPKGWFDQSTTSTAWSDKKHLLDPIPRTVFFGISVVIMIYEIIKYWK